MGKRMTDITFICVDQEGTKNMVWIVCREKVNGILKIT